MIIKKHIVIPFKILDFLIKVSEIKHYHISRMRSATTSYKGILKCVLKLTKKSVPAMQHNVEAIKGSPSKRKMSNKRREIIKQYNE